LQLFSWLSKNLIVWDFLYSNTNNWFLDCFYEGIDHSKTYWSWLYFTQFIPVTESYILVMNKWLWDHFNQVPANQQTLLLR